MLQVATVVELRLDDLVVEAVAGGVGDPAHDGHDAPAT